MTRPGEIQVGRTDRWLRTTESGLQACYGKAPLRRGFSMSHGDPGIVARVGRMQLVPTATIWRFAHKTQTIV